MELRGKRLIFAYLVVLFIATAQARGNKKGAATRIAGGQIITIDNAPYIVQLKFPYQGVFCGGTLVTSTHVVTAAHCFNEFDYNNVSVIGGISERGEDGGVRSKIISVTISPSYNRDTMHSDIAVAKLETPLIGPSIQAVPLCSKSLTTGDLLQVTGWGTEQTLALYGSVELRTVFLPVVSHDDCTKRYADFDFKVTDSMLCTYVDGKDACRMDSGGPAIRGGELCGVVSWGDGCANKDSPGVFTNINTVREFVEAALKK